MYHFIMFCGKKTREFCLSREKQWKAQQGCFVMMQIEAKAQKGPRAEQKEKEGTEGEDDRSGYSWSRIYKNKRTGQRKTRLEFYSGRVYT